MPEEAGIGLTPHSEAKAASEWRRSGLLPAVIRRVAAVSGPMPKMLTRARRRTCESFKLGLQVVDLLAELGSGMYLAAAMGPSRRPGRKPLQRVTRARVARPSRVSRSWAGAVTTRAFIWLMAWVRALTAESFALLSIRIISTSPSPDLGVASATPARARLPSPRRWDRLPLPIACCPVRTIFDDGITPTGQEAYSGAVGTVPSIPKARTSPRLRDHRWSSSYPWVVATV